MIVTPRDVFGGSLPRPCDVWVERLDASASRHRQSARDVPPNGRAEFSTAWQNTYRVRVVLEGHAEASVNVDGSTAEVEIRVPVDPSAVVGFVWPHSPGPFPGVVFEDLDDVRRGALLNVWAKMFATSFGVVPVGAYVRSVEEVRVDRIICRMSPAIEDAMLTSVAAGDVDLVTSAIGHTPPDGYDNGPSIKSRDEFGSLQVSLLMPRTAGGPTLADVDVDEERSFVHAFRAIGHHLTGNKTDPVEVQQILAAAGIDAGWRPVLAA